MSKASESRSSGSRGTGGGGRNAGRPSVSAGWNRRRLGQQFVPVRQLHLTDWDEFYGPVDDEPLEGFEAIFDALAECR